MSWRLKHSGVRHDRLDRIKRCGARALQAILSRFTSRQNTLWNELSDLCAV
jgi:hypothetical protein